MKKNFIASLLLLGIIVRGGVALNSNNKNRIVSVDADYPHVSTSLSSYYASSSQTPDSNYYKALDANVDYPLADGTIVNMNAFNVGASTITQIRNYHNENTNYYVYLKYNSTHNQVGQLGNGLVFNATAGYLLNSVSLYNGYQVGDAFQIETYNQATGLYVAEVVDQMFSGSNKTYSYTFSKPTTSFKITHYLHNASSHALVAWKESSVFYEEAYTLSFNSNGGTSVNSQYYSKTGSDVTFEPVAPTKPNDLTTKYIFAGWYTDSECTAGNEFVFGQILTSDTVLYAKWNTELISGYTVTFESNGGTAIASQTIEPNSLIVRPSDPTKSSDAKYSYTFDNWYSDSSLTSVYDFDTPVTSDLILYAKYISSNTSAPLNAIRYDLGAHTTDNPESSSYWDNTAYSHSKNYCEINVNSHESFDKPKDYPNINLTVTKLSKNGGIDYLNTTYRNNPVIRMAKMTISSLETGNNIIYVRALCEKYSSNSDVMHLFANDSISPCDTEEAPYEGGYTNRLLQASFNANDNVTSVSFAIGETGDTYSQVKIRYVYIIYANSPALDGAISFAQGFNSANVCGSTDSSGLDEIKWANQASIFDSLSSSVKLIFTTFNSSQEDIDECLERYDRVIYLHGEDYDFMGRVAAGKVTPKSNLGLLLINNVTKNNSLSVIAVISLISLSAISLYVVCKRRKEE